MANLSCELVKFVYVALLSFEDAVIKLTLQFNEEEAQKLMLLALNSKCSLGQTASLIFSEALALKQVVAKRHKNKYAHFSKVDSQPLDDVLCAAALYGAD